MYNRISPKSATGIAAYGLLMNPSLTTALVFPYTLHILSIYRMEFDELMYLGFHVRICSPFLFLNLPVEADCLPLLLREAVLVHCTCYLALNGGVDNPFSTK